LLLGLLFNHKDGGDKLKIKLHQNCQLSINQFHYHVMSGIFQQTDIPINKKKKNSVALIPQANYTD
jgi:hypothetical protein